MSRMFTGSFTQQQPIPADAIDAAVSVLESGRLHRYNLTPDEVGEVAKFEREYCDWQGSSYCLAVTSGGQALQIAMRACGVVPGDKVMTNAFTLAPVPGAISAVGGEPVLVEIDENLRLDFADLEHKIATSNARYLLLSHMRGHLCDMDRLLQICGAADVSIIEDCAHTMGASLRGKRSGSFGKVACFSTQTYKHMNSGEGGVLTTDDPDLAARATILSGSYMLYERHGAGPLTADYAQPKLNMPNCSARMDALRAAILRPQLRALDHNIECWNARYRIVEDALTGHTQIATITRPSDEHYVGSSIQFRMPGFTPAQCENLQSAASDRGVELKWFGATQPKGFTSSHHSWHYVSPHALPQTDRIMATLFDMRLPLMFTEADCVQIADLICDAIDEITA